MKFQDDISMPHSYVQTSRNQYAKLGGGGGGGGGGEGGHENI